MANNGIGQDGYMQYQKETTFNTAATASMTQLPIAPDSKISGKVMQIENNIQVGQRFKQDPDAGREMCAGSFGMDAHPALIGGILNMFLGASDGDTDNADGTYTHYWLQPLSGERVGTSFTLEQALGSDLAERITGCTIHALHIEGDNEGNLKVMCDVVGKEYTADITRITSFSYPSQIPYNFSNVVLNINPDGVGAFDVNVNSFTLDIDLNYDIERYKTGADSILQPVFNGVPIVNFSCELDADPQYVDYARAITSAALTATITSTENASGSTPWSTVVELPRAYLSQDTEIANGQERLTMSLDWDCSYGATSTNSGSDSVMFEIRHTDTTSTYTA